MNGPTRLEVLVNSGVNGPDSYDLSSLPQELIPLLTEKRFNDGQYNIVGRCANAEVYFYTFKETIAASEVNEQTIDYGNTCILGKKRLEEILPPVSNEENTPDFEVPWKFVVVDSSLLEVLTKGKEIARQVGIQEGIQVGIQEGRQEILDKIKDFPEIIWAALQLQPPQPLQPLELPQPLELTKDILQIDGDESVRKNVLLDYLQKQYGQHLEIDGNEASSGKNFYSRFYRSKEDFYMKCKENDEAEISAMYFMTDDELEMDTGDCQDASKKSDKFQVMAFMTRAAADEALSAMNVCKLFKRINIYASLIDYTSGNSKQNFKLVFDFINRQSSLYISSEELSIARTFRRAAHILKPNVY